MKKIAYLMAAALMLVGCDKIEPGPNGEYTISTGSTENLWAEGAHVYVEKYTGPRCTNCPAADRTLDAMHKIYGERLVVVSVNSKTESFGAPGPNSPDMRTEVGAAWEDHWGVTSFPTAYINRIGTTAYTAAMSNIGGGIEAALREEPIATVNLTASASGRNIAIDATVEMKKEYDGNLSLSLILVEDSMAYWQMDGTAPVADYVHNHMLRASITDTWGKSLTIGSTAGSQKSEHMDYAVQNDDIVIEHCRVVALVSDSEKRVLNCTECKVQ